MVLPYQSDLILLFTVHFYVCIEFENITCY